MWRAGVRGSADVMERWLLLERVREGNEANEGMRANRCHAIHHLSASVGWLNTR